MHNSSDQAVESRLAEWLCYLLVVRCMLLLVGPPMGLVFFSYTPPLSIFLVNVPPPPDVPQWIVSHRLRQNEWKAVSFMAIVYF